MKLLILDTNLNRPGEEDGVVADGEASGETANVGQEAGNQLDTDFDQFNANDRFELFLI